MTKEEQIKAIWDEVFYLMPDAWTQPSEKWLPYVKEHCPFLTAHVEAIRKEMTKDMQIKAIWEELEKWLWNTGRGSSGVGLTVGIEITMMDRLQKACPLLKAQVEAIKK